MTRPQNEEQRLAALKRLGILDTPAEERFDRITRVAQRLFDVPVAVVALVDATRTCVKAAAGIDAREWPRDGSFCAQAILNDVPLVVPDASRDPRFASNPLVAGPAKIRFYAGQPLSVADGSHVGTLCIMDRKPRGMTTEDLEALVDLSAWAEGELYAARLSRKQQTLILERAELRQKASTDVLTRVWNRATILEMLTHELTRALREEEPLGVVMADVDHFKKINDTHGHQAGDAVLVETARRIRACLRPYDAVGRYGGEEFIILLPGADAQASARTSERIRAAVGGSAVAAMGKQIPVTISLGATASEFPEKVKAEALIKAADGALYKAKESGRNRVVIAD